MSPRVCIVTPGYISSTPRVVREADALANAGFDVRVVFTQGQLEDVRQFDADVLRSATWRHASFRWSSGRQDERWAHLRSGIRHRVAQALPESTWSVAGIAERAEGRVYPDLAALAAAEPADMYIGHYPTGLAAAAWAARRHGAQVGYDIEDLYADTFPESPAWAAARTRIVTLERRYVRRCAHISAVSQPVADVFRERYATRPPVIVYNCHPWSDRARNDGEIRDRSGSALSLYWYSQVIGLDRGIQDAIRAAALVQPTPNIHLRGALSDEVRAALVALADQCGIRAAVHFHPPCPPSELLSRASEHDVGLALETDHSVNRDLTVTNKFFMYLTAGLAIAASDVRGHREVMRSIPAVGRLHRLGEPNEIAAHLNTWQTDAQSLTAAKQASLLAAKVTWNAEHEGRKIVASVSAALGMASAAPLASCG